jgi:hypothetical protein
LQAPEADPQTPERADVKRYSQDGRQPARAPREDQGNEGHFEDKRAQSRQAVEQRIFINRQGRPPAAQLSPLVVHGMAEVVAQGPVEAALEPLPEAGKEVNHAEQEPNET